MIITFRILRCIKIAGKDFWGNPTGKERVYLKGNKLLYTIDHDSSAWTADPDLYPHFEVANTMKRVADSIVSKAFGKKVFDENIRFNWYMSTYNKGYYYNFSDEGIKWTTDYIGGWMDTINQEPNEFTLKYSFNIDPSIRFRDEIYIILDSNANMKENNFERFAASDLKDGIRFNYPSAVMLAKENGFIQNDTITTEWILYNFFEKEHDSIGTYTILLKQKIDEYTRKGERKGQIEGFIFYKIWAFDAINGNFISHGQAYKPYSFSGGCIVSGGLIRLNELNDPRKQK